MSSAHVDCQLPTDVGSIHFVLTNIELRNVARIFWTSAAPAGVAGAALKPGSGGTRFSAPPGSGQPPFRVLYACSQARGAFLETEVRDGPAGRPGPFRIARSRIERRSVGSLSTAVPLTLVDLRGDLPTIARVPVHILHRYDDYSCSQAWAALIWSWRQPQTGVAPDGILYPSRFGAGENVAVFDRALGKLSCVGAVPLLHHPDLAGWLRRYAVEIVPDDPP